MQILMNLAARTLLIWAFVQFGWLTLRWGGEPIHGFWQYLLFAFAGGILLTILALLLAVPYLLLAAGATVLTLGLFVFVLNGTFYSILVWVISLIFPENVVLHGFCPTVGCGFILSITNSLIDGLLDDGKKS